ncbi:alpha/beta hydrolase [Aureimonas populi]|uniref:Palmitoyl-protein thioesterase ABHD10, mitochondrial n=1 Tax=Aureimonas populi TaxID=1701758 RepID=A0ABW5CN02_9HYPH|nr:alpha/beta hydrolase [Aureimonas populi]
MTEQPPSFHEVSIAGAPRRLAFLKVEGEGPTIVWLGGYRSDMRGTKAERLSEMARGAGWSFLRLDYSGHGESDGRFEDGTITGWTAEARAVIEAQTSGALILVGSSMGAWIALRLARELEAGRVASLLLLAPAPDFTSRLVEPSLTGPECVALERDGFIARPSDYGPEPTVYTQGLLDDGCRAAVMDGPIDTGCPVRIIQGMADPDVPYDHALELVSHLPGEGVVLTLVADGDHRLAREEDLARMESAVSDLVRDARQA